MLPCSLVLSLVVQVAEPRLGVFEYDDLREGQLEAAGAVVLILVGGVLLGRVRRNRSRRNLLLGAGLLVLATTELFVSIATPLADSLARSTFATWTTAGGGVLAAIALAVAAWLPDRALPRGPGSVALTLAAAAFALSAIAVASGLLPLPAPFERLPLSAAEIEPGGEHWALLLAELVTATGLAACAARLALLADAERDQLWRWIAIALGLAGVAFVNYALVPSQFTELLYVGDVFLLLAVGSLLAGAILEITSAEAALVRSAVSTERTRVADELRAGVAQELAFIASQTDLFTRRPDRQPALDELAASVERALDESRGAISELARPVDEPLAAALRDVARDVAVQRRRARRARPRRRRRAPASGSRRAAPAHARVRDRRDPPPWRPAPAGRAARGPARDRADDRRRAPARSGRARPASPARACGGARRDVRHRPGGGRRDARRDRLRLTRDARS